MCSMVLLYYLDFFLNPFDERPSRTMAIADNTPLTVDVIALFTRRITRRIQITIKINPAVLPLIFNSL